MFLSRRRRRANRDATIDLTGMQPVERAWRPTHPIISPTARLEEIRRLVDDAIEAEKARVWAEVGIGDKR